MKSENPMKKMHIEKLVLNMGCGTVVNVEHAKKILEDISGKKAIIIRTKKRSLFGVPRGKPIGCAVTIRGGIGELLKRLLSAKNNTLKKSNFDKLGNFAFGIAEYIDIPGMSYDPKIGMLGLDVCVTMTRPGYRIKKKSHSRSVGRKHLITKEEAVEFIKTTYGIKIE
jgi:large subunit ribosomal protein L5